jgi:hypothetical protein
VPVVSMCASADDVRTRVDTNAAAAGRRRIRLIMAHCPAGAAPVRVRGRGGAL